MTSTEISSANKIMLGTTEATAMYIGSTLVWSAATQPSLPYDAEIEYLESTGTQHVITELYGTLELGFEVKFSLTATRSPEDGNSATIFGARLTYNNRGFLLSSYLRTTVQFGSVLNQSILGSLSTNTDYVFSFLDDKIYVDNVLAKLININLTFTTPQPISLFALYQLNTVIEHLLGKIYYVRFFNRNTLETVADFIPVRVGLAGYMYDRVSGQLFGNDGTGSFTLGPDKQ